MKRFRIFGVDFDTRVHTLTTEIQDHWEQRVKQPHKQNREQTERALICQFGEASADQKKTELHRPGPKAVFNFGVPQQVL